VSLACHLDITQHTLTAAINRQGKGILKRSKSRDILMHAMQAYGQVEV
jgi:hypothetical protein